MADIRISDLVDPQSIEDLKELDETLQKVKGTYVSAARELLKGLKMPIEGMDDVRKLNETLAAQSKRTQAATEELGQAVERQQQVVERTTNGISRELAALEKEAAAKRASYTVSRELIALAESYNGSIAQNTRRLATLEAQLRRNKEAQQLLAKEERAGAVSAAESISRRAALRQEEIGLANAKRDLLLTLNNEMKANLAAEGSYKQLSLQLELMKRAYKEMSEAEKAGANGRLLKAGIEELDAHLKDAAAGMGEFQRNVGNYAIAGESAARANGNLKMSVQQVVRELPSAAVGLNTFFLAISNNIPQVIDAMNRAKEANASLAASGKKGVPVWMQLVKSLVSWQTALVVGITLLTMYGDKIVAWIGNLFKGGEASRKAAEMQKAHNETMRKASETYTNTLAQNAARNIAAYRKLQAEYKALGDDMAARKKWIKENASAFQELGYKVNSVSDAEKFFRTKTKDVIESFKLRAQAAAYAAESVELYQKAIEMGQKNVRAPKVGSKVGSIELKDVYGLSSAEIGNLFKAQYDKGGNERKDVEAGLINVTQAVQKQIFEYAARPNLEEKKRLEKQADALAGKSGELERKYAEMMKGTGLADSGKGDTGTSTATGGEKVDWAAIEAERRKELLEARKQTAGLLKAQQRQAQDEQAQAAIDGMQDQTKRELAQIEKDAQEKREAIKEDARKMAESLAALSYKEYLAEDPKNNWKGWKATSMGRMSSEDWQKAVTDGNADLGGFDEKTQRRILEARKAFNERMLAAEEDLQGKLRKAYEAGADSRVEAMQDEYAGAQAARNEAYRKAQADLKKKAARGEVKPKDYERQSAEMQEDYAVETAQSSVSLIRKQLETEKLSAEKRKELQRRLMQAMGDLAEAEADREKGINDRKYRDMKDHQEKVKDILQKTAEAISNVTALASAIYDGKIQQVEAEEEAEQEHYEKEQERIQGLADSGVITEEEAEARKRAAQAKTEKKTEELERKKRQLQYKQAVWNKMNSIAQTGIATAMGIMQALAMWPPNIPLAAFVGAMGAVQLATILATPIPKYAKGTDSHKGGLAVVGDGGRPEVVVMHGRYWLTPDKPTLVDMPQGAQVLPDAAALAPTFVEGLTPAAAPGVVVDNDYSTLQRELARRLDRGNALLRASIADGRRRDGDAAFALYKLERMGR